ncbi:MAG: WYL domain-containing protein, partial [Lachnospira sp.]|nr:WYL domain-containing protein [Lachnospira sp.]
MFHGEEENITLRCENSMAGIIIDRFGKEVPLRKDGDEYFTARVKVAVSHQFYGWVVGLGTGIQIAAPEKIKADYKEYLKHIISVLH